MVWIGYKLIITFYNQYALERMFNDIEGGGRLEIWSKALEVFEARPLFGGGLNAGSTYSSSGTTYTTHSIFIDILCDSGLIGMCSMIYFIVSNCLKCDRYNAGFLVVLGIAFFVPMFFINGFNTTTFYFPLIVLTIFSRYLEKNSFERVVTI